MEAFSFYSVEGISSYLDIGLLLLFQPFTFTPIIDTNHVYDHPFNVGTTGVS